MPFRYIPGFVIFTSGRPGPVFVAPHSSLTYRSAEREDVGAENVAFLAAQQGGSAIISVIPRHGVLGIDYNRAPPSPAMLLKEADKIRDSAALSDYYRNWAWAARSTAEHAQKARIYGSFWRTASALGKKEKKPFFVFCHTLGSRAKNLPSAIDLVTGRGEWIDKKKVERIALRLNRKYDFSAYKEDWKRDMIFHAMQEKIFMGERKPAGIRKQWLEQDLKKASEITKRTLHANAFGTEEYFSAIEKAMDKSDMKITVENIYFGDTAKPVAPLLARTKGIGLEVESQSFLNENHAEDVVKIIDEIVREF